MDKVCQSNLLDVVGSTLLKSLVLQVILVAPRDPTAPLFEDARAVFARSGIEPSVGPLLEELGGCAVGCDRRDGVAFVSEDERRM